MSKSCVLTPRDKDGKEPRLYKELEEYFGDRKKASTMYYKINTDYFRKEFGHLKTAEDGKPYLKDLIKTFGLDTIQSDNDTIRNLSRKYKPAERSYQSMMNLQEQAIEFNKNEAFNDKFYATVEENADNTAIVTIKRKTPEAQGITEKIEANFKLNRKIESILESWGIGIDSLTSLEERMGINGVADFSVAANAATGIRNLIRLAKGKAGVEALAEEFGHFAVDAVGNIPLKQRMLDILTDHEVLRRVLGDSYESYASAYNNNTSLMAEEALGKLVAKELNRTIQEIPNRTVFERFITKVKEFFKSKDEDEIDAAVNEVMKDVRKLTDSIVSNKLPLNADRVTGKLLYSLENELSKEEKLLNKILDQEYKRWKIYANKNETFDKNQNDIITTIESNIRNAKYIEGITNYMTSSYGRLCDLVNRMRKLNTENVSMKEKFILLKNVKNYMSSYSSIMKDIRDAASKARFEGDVTMFSAFSNLLDANDAVISAIASDYKVIAKDMFKQFIQPFVDEKIANIIASNPEMKDSEEVKNMSAENLLTFLDTDISVLDRYIDSAADSKDEVLNIYDAIVKKQKGLARLETINEEKEILKAAKELRDAGIMDTSWMYERDKDGKLTGNYIQEIDYSKYYERKKAATDAIKAKYPDKLTNEELHAMNSEISRWYNNNTHKEDDRTVPNDEYKNPKFYEIMQDPAKKKFYDFIMSKKQHYDTFLPHTFASHAPQIRRDFIQRIKNSDKKGKYLWESIKDNLVRREDDEDFGSTMHAIQDFEGNRVMKLPIYYTVDLKDMEDLSTDAVSTLIAYASMANEFNRMNEVIDALEVGINVVSDRKVNQKRAGRKLVEKIVFQERDKTVENELTKSGMATRALQRLNKFMEMQVYGIEREDEGTFGKSKIDRAKTADLLNKMTSLSSTALSVLTGVANTFQNSFIDRIEARSKRFFNEWELTKAEGIYMAELPKLLAQAGDRLKTSKLALFSEMFNVSQDYKNHVRDIDWNRNGWAKKLFSESALYFTTSFGDHFNQHRMAIALAERYKMKDSRGNEVSLWDCLEVDDDTYTLKIKEGYTKMDGTEWTKEDTIKMSNKIRGVEDTLYGIYNSEDKNALVQSGIGRLVMFYRNWMRPLMLARYGSKHYNYDVADYMEGYFVTGAKFMSTLMKDLKNAEFDFSTRWDELSDMERGNIHKAIAEIGGYIALYALISILNFNGDDNKDRPWAVRMASYAMLRLKTDMGALLPSPGMVNEIHKLTTSPAACVSYIEKLRKVVGLVEPWNWDSFTKEVTSGPYKGMTQAEKIGLDVLPFVKPIVNVLDPDSPAKWYK